MKTFQIIGLVLLLSISASAHVHHAKHNMIFFGENEFYASHLVYKSPHNYQVLVKLQLDVNTKAVYAKVKKEFPKDLFIFLLDTMDIKEIESQEVLTGKILREDESGQRIDLATGLTFNKTQFKILFFNELPLSLEATPKP
ncbi:hypothetical protein [Bdellovibrio sp. HCB337]|uniref:hypothetical protein n=1 Tax=Bdellovibrio sp. HCB337 TaxID=3394358 RepID=UPI0039A57B8A